MNRFGLRSLRLPCSCDAGSHTGALLTREMRNPHMRLLSLSTGSLSHLMESDYHDLRAIQYAMTLLHAHAEIDGFEFQKIAEWDIVGPPRDDHGDGRPEGFRRDAWESCRKHTISELAGAIGAAGLPVLSVHANRDVGICLCNGSEEDIARGDDLVCEAISLCIALRTNLAVIHIWDTRAKDIDSMFLRRKLDRIQSSHPEIKATVENVPTSVEGLTPLELAKQFASLTLDTRWACMYDELERFEEVLPRIANIHLRARLLEQEWIFESSDWTLEEVVRLIRETWKYSGLITLEPERGYHGHTVEDLVVATRALRTMLGYPKRRLSSRVFA